MPMEPKVQTSFIPKKPFSSGTAVRPRGVSIFMLLGVALFIITIFLGGAVFLYERYLTGAIASKNAQLERARAAFEPALIEDLKRMSGRIALARDILNNHLAPSAIFSLLEQSTLTTVRFRSFTYALSGSKATIVMRGEARSFADVAVQSDTFTGGRRLRDIVFSNLNLDSSGHIAFDFSATLDPSLILYRNGDLRPAPLPALAPAPTLATTTPR